MDAATVHGVLRAGARLEREQAYQLARTVRAALGADPEFDQEMEAATLGAVEAERRAAFRRADAAVRELEAQTFGQER